MGIIKWFTQFLAVDNSVNEHTVNGVYWAAVSTILIGCKVFGIDAVTTEMLYITVGASLASFGIAGFKRG